MGTALFDVPKSQSGIIQSSYAPTGNPEIRQGGDKADPSKHGGSKSRA